MIGIELFEFQDKLVDSLLENCLDKKSKSTVVVKSATGSGKTIILLSFIERYLNEINSNVVFVWLCPGKGDLETQSMRQMERLLPMIKACDLQDVLLGGFEVGTVAFVNWELITKKGNRALSEGEKKNLFNRISKLHKDGKDFIVIVDEEHSHDTKKADTVISALSALKTIRVSATARKNPLSDYYEIDELDVIESGLITRALYINEDITSRVNETSEHEHLIDLAIKKRIQIKNGYINRNIDVNPLVIIQFPNTSDAMINNVEEILSKQGYTYENGCLSIWMSDSDKKRNLENLSKNNGQQLFLLMKQAINTGWDCPRAKILVKLRESMNEDFEIQTIGRIRRMPEWKHYEDDLLDFCYLYTYDEKYKEGVLNSISSAYEVTRLFVKDISKDFTLTKELRDRDKEGVGDREAFLKVYDTFCSKYNLSSDFKHNKNRLEEANFIIGDEIIGYVREGKFITSSSILDKRAGNFVQTKKKIDTHINGIDLLHSIDSIKSSIGMKSRKTKVVLQRLFLGSVPSKSKILNLGLKEFYAFIINNEKLIKEVMKIASSTLSIQMSLNTETKKSLFRIPSSDLFPFDPFDNDIEIIESNVYKGYNTSMINGHLRSKCERLFEYECNSRDDIEWYYKNGDKGQQYFSIVYLDNFGKQWLFYPDYIVKKKNGDVWIIETKGGETPSGVSQNIDSQTINKFEAFKIYAKNNNVNWGFVRDKNDKLRINNESYADDLNDSNWHSIKSIF